MHLLLSPALIGGGGEMGGDLIFSKNHECRPRRRFSRKISKLKNGNPLFTGNQFGDLDAFPATNLCPSGSHSELEREVLRLLNVTGSWSAMGGTAALGVGSWRLPLMTPSGQSTANFAVRHNTVSAPPQCATFRSST
jgi:hypothetical protein